MSEGSNSPFVPTTTPTIERANRLLGLRAHPGFPDLIRILQDMIQEQIDTCTNYPGWDPQVIVVLKVRQQCATEARDAVLSRINSAIMDGINEQKAATNLPVNSAAEALDHGDFVRQEVLSHFSELDNEVRSAGSY